MEIASFVISIIDLAAFIVLTIISILLVRKQNNLISAQERQDEKIFKLEQADVEISISNMISAASYKILEYAIIVNNNPEDSINSQLFNSALEQYRNTYEEACGKYLENKVDRESFKRRYQAEIRNLVEDEAQKTYYSDTQSSYINTIRVYREWFNS